MEEYLKQRADELKEMVEAELNAVKVRADRLIESFLSNTLSTYKANEEPSFFEKIQQELDSIDNGWGKAGAKLGHDSITDHVVVKDWSSATLEEVPVDYGKPNKEGCYSVAGSDRLFPTERLANMFLDSLKPVEQWKPEERWKPETNEWYWKLRDTGVPLELKWTGSKQDWDYYHYGNFFRSEQDAIAARERVKKALQNL